MIDIAIEAGVLNEGFRAVVHPVAVHITARADEWSSRVPAVSCSASSASAASAASFASSAARRASSASSGAEPATRWGGSAAAADGCTSCAGLASGAFFAETSGGSCEFVSPRDAGARACIVTFGGAAPETQIALVGCATGRCYRYERASERYSNPNFSPMGHALLGLHEHIVEVSFEIELLEVLEGY
jgi:hypothetical protein